MESLSSWLTPSEKERLARINEDGKYAWELHARPEQLPPKTDWFYWILLAGRGAGKTRAAAEYIRHRVCNEEAKNLLIVARTPKELKKYCIEGKSGILNVFPPHQRPKYSQYDSSIKFHTGAIAYCYSAETPDAIRGAGIDTAWFDEFVTYRYLNKLWESFIFSMREGDPKIIISTTPRPLKLLKELIKDKDSHVTRGNSYDNAENLSTRYVKNVLDKYKGTRLGRQEINAEILEDIEGALWTSAIIERNRIDQEHFDKHIKPNLKIIVVAVDPAASSKKKGIDGEKKSSDETGIVVVGLGEDNRGYVLGDYSLVGTPYERAAEVKRVFHFWQANYIVAEKNNGGDMVEFMLKSVDHENVMTVKMVHASRGKHTRAQPISSLNTQNYISIVGLMPQLEDELTTWIEGEESPNRLDAMVWGFSDIMPDLDTDDFDESEPVIMRL